MEIWQDVPSAPTYQASIDGRVRRVYESGKKRELSAYQKRSGKSKVKKKTLWVKLWKDGTPRETQIHRIVADTFELDGRGDRVYHKNGIITDNHANNLKRATNEEIGKMFGAQSRRKPVKRSKGLDVKFYPSARTAAKDNYCSRQTIADACNGKYKSNCTGYDYSWE